MNEKMRMKRQWNGKYRGINFEIQNFGIGGKECWTFYFYLSSLQLDPKDFKKFWIPPTYDEKNRVHYNYMDSIVNSIDFHCGCTYYEKEGGPDSKVKYVKIGCDYQHLYDDDHSYNEIIIEKDCHGAIDSLYLLVKRVNLWCGYCGAWGFEGFTTKDGENHLCEKCSKRVEGGIQ